MAPPEFVEELLRRSQSLPLSMLNIHHSIDELDVSVISRFLCEGGVGRPIRRLQLGLDIDNSQELHFPAFLPSLLDGLAELALLDDEKLSYDKKYEPLLDLFAACTFRLKKLTLRCNGRRISFLHDTLNALALMGIPGGSELVCIDEFLQVLSSLKDLEQLQLEDVFAHFAFGNSTNPVAITFPRLKFLVLMRERVYHCVDFLDILSFPPTTRLLFVPERSPLEEFDRLIASVCRRFSHSDMPLPRFLRIELSTSSDNANTREDLVRISFDPNLINIDLDVPHFDIACYVFEVDPLQPRTIYDTLLEFIQSLPTSEIRSVELCGSCVDLNYPQALIDALAALPSLDTLHIEGGSSMLPAVFALSLPPLRYGKVDGEGSTNFLKSYFPKLQTLVYAYSDPVFDLPFAFFVEVLSFWSGNGQRKLRTLVLLGSEWGASWSRKLEQFSDDVIWQRNLSRQPEEPEDDVGLVRISRRYSE